MHTSGIFTTHKFKVSCKPGETLKLIPFGDAHREAPLHSHSWWKRFLDYAKSQKNAIFLGMGDYFDGCSTSERTSIARSDLHDSTIANIEDTYKGVTKTLANELQFMNGRLIGLIGGNHYYEYRDGATRRLQRKSIAVIVRIEHDADQCAAVDIRVESHGVKRLAADTVAVVGAVEFRAGRCGRW